MVAVADDPLLLNWEKLRGRPVNAPASGDSCIWKEGDAYLGLIGCRTLLESKNLIDWKVRSGDFLGGSSFPVDDGSCPTLLPLGDKHILLLFSHGKGGQYLLGDYDSAKPGSRPMSTAASTTARWRPEAYTLPRRWPTARAGSSTSSTSTTASTATIGTN